MTLEIENPTMAEWLRRLTWTLLGMPSPEREEIVAETRAHLEERVAGGRSVAEALAGFGSPELYGRRFMDEMYLSAAIGSRRSGDSLRAVMRVAHRSFVASLAFAVVVIVGSMGIGFLVAGIWKLFDPGHVGLWVSATDFSMGVIDHPETSHEMLGLWMYPVCAGLALLAWLVCRFTLLWAVRSLAPKP